MMLFRRRKVMAGVVTAFLAAPAILRAQPLTFRFGLTPVFLDNDWQLLDLLRTHLSAEIGRPVEFLQRRTYKEVTALLLMGEIEAAWLCGYPLLQNIDRLSALALPVWQGQPNYSAKIITGTGRAAQGLADLRGDIHAYSDPDSNSGHLVTVSELLKNNQRPEAFFARSFFTYGHRNVVRSVARGLAQSGSVDGYVYNAMQRAEPELVARTRIVWESERFGFPPIVVAREVLGSRPVQSFFAALTTMQDSDAGQAALQLLQLDGFTAPDAHSFDRIAARMRIVAERRMLRPVARLTNEMGRSSDALTPIPDAAIPRRKPEIAKLYDTYNGLIRAVAERDATTRRLADRERFVSLGRLAGTLAHEVNNPLGGLLNTVDTLRAYPDRPDVVKSAADLLDRGLRHMRDVVRATLDVHRDAPERRPLSPADLEDLNLLIRPEAERRGQHLHWDVALPEDCVAGLPAGPVRQIVLNLLLNASSVAGYGGEIGLRLAREGSFALLAVQDSGPGLPDHLHARLLSDAPLEPGGGVGLRLVRELVQGTDGHITLGQSPQGLQEIQVHLPCAGNGGQDA